MIAKNTSLVAKTLAAFAAASIITSSLTAFAGHGSGHSSGHAGSHHASSSHSSKSHHVSHSNGSTHKNRPSNATAMKSKSLGKTASTSVSKKGKTIPVSVTKKVSGSASKSPKPSPAKMTKHHHHPHHHHHHHHWHHGWTYPYPYPQGDGGVVIETDPAAPLYTAQVVGDAAEPIDLELLGVEQIDGGDAASGPAYRVTFRNNSSADVDQAFDVALLASNDDQPSDDAPQATSRVEGIQANQVLTVDVRLPLEAGGMSYLTAVVNSTEEVQEATMDNNFATLNSSDIATVAN